MGKYSKIEPKPKFGKVPTLIGKREFVWERQTYIMAILNVTPDSFSGDGILKANRPSPREIQLAVDQGLRFEDEGADIIDVGGESTRPPKIYSGAKPISTENEMERVIPVIQQLADRTDVPISIDTRRASVSRVAVANGAAMINDVSMLKWDKCTPVTVAELNVPLVISHNRRKSEYDDVMADVISDLDQAIELAITVGVQTRNIIVDPGIGFGKTIKQSLEAQRRLNELDVLGLPVLIGTSRKSSIGAVLGDDTEDRIEGTAATVALAIQRGADLVRVHDVAKMLKVARMADALVRGW